MPQKTEKDKASEPRCWAPSAPAAIAKMTEWLRLLVEPESVCELRVLGVESSYGKPHTESGYYDTDHLADMAKAALGISRRAKGVYLTLNPLDADLLSRRCNRLDRAAEDELAKDRNVRRRRWLLVDADPRRMAGISATDAEKALAHETILSVREFLRSRAWPEPILSDSGNGYHLLYRVDLPTDDGGMVQRCLHALAKDWDSEAVEIDTSVYNPARICKLPGTLSRKGDHTPTRPHRWSRVLEVPG